MNEEQRPASRSDEAKQATIRALRIIASGQSPYDSLPPEVRETSANAVDYLTAVSERGTLAAVEQYVKGWMHECPTDTPTVKRLCELNALFERNER